MAENNKNLTPFAVLVAGILIAGAIIYVNKGKGDAIEKGKAEIRQENPSGAGQVKEISIDNEPIIGNLSAPVTLIEFSDFECPFCGRHANNTFSQIKAEYVDTGKVKVVFKNFPLPFHKDAQKAAEAGECAFLQGKFWEYKEVLFKNQGALARSDLVKYAADLGLDAGKFTQCLDSGQTKKEVEDDLQDGNKAGIEGTPAFFINGESLYGAQPFAVFQEAIEKYLKK